MSGESNRERARERLAVIAHGIRDPGEDEAAARLLERIAAAGEPELQALLLELGARAVIQEVR